MQGDGIDLKTRPLRLARPVQIGRLQRAQFRQRILHRGGIVRGECIVDQLFHPGALAVEHQCRVKVRVVGPDGFRLVGVVVGVDHADLGVVHPRVGMAVADDLRGFPGFARRGLGLGRRAFRLRCGFLGRGQFEIVVLILDLVILGHQVNRPAAPLALAKNALIHQRVLGRGVILVRQIGMGFPQPRDQGTIANGRAVFRNMDKDKITQGIGHGQTGTFGLAAIAANLKRFQSLCSPKLYGFRCLLSAQPRLIGTIQPRLCQGRTFGIAAVISTSRSIPPVISPSRTQPSAYHQSP